MKPTILAAAALLTASSAAAAAQVGVVGDQLIVTEKSGTVETIELRSGAVVGAPVAGGRNIALDAPVAAQTGGAPIDIATDGDLVAVLESNGGGVTHLTQFHVDADGNLNQVVSTPIASPSNGVAIATRP